MKQNARKGLALLLAGVLVLTSLGYTTNNVLKAANSDNIENEQQLENGAEGNADTAVNENPEVKQESIDVSGSDQTEPDAGGSGSSEGNGNSGNQNPSGGLGNLINRMSDYSVRVGESITIYETGLMLDSKTWTSSDTKIARVSNGSKTSVTVTGVKAGTVTITHGKGLLSTSYTLTVEEAAPAVVEYPAYLYALMPGKTMDGGGSADSKWFGLGAVNLVGVENPAGLSHGQTISGYSFGTVIKALYPDLTVDGVTYKYAAPGSAEASQYGYYTISLIRAVCSDGANRGSNNYNPYVANNTNTYHIDYSISLNSTRSSFVNFNVMMPGSSEFNALAAYAQQVSNGTAESRLRKPAATDVPGEITRDGKEYTFDGWYKDEACTVKADFSGTVEGNINYYGKYVEKASYTITYTDGVDGEEVFADINIKAYKGAATPAVADPVRTGYEFAGWTPAVAEKVSGNATYTATWTAKNDTAYTVEYYYQKNGAYSAAADSSDSREGTTGSAVSVKDTDKTPTENNYVFDSSASNVLSGKIKADGSLVLKVYFKEQFTVKYSKGEHGTFDTQVKEGLSYGQTTPAFEGQPAGEAGYEFTGWTPAVAETVEGSIEYVAQWKAKSGIAYTVEYYYEKNGSYGDTADGSVRRDGTTGADVAVTDADKTPAGSYIFDEDADNVLSGKVKGDGSLTLKVYFKEQFTVSYSKGDHGTFDTQANSGLSYGQTTPGYSGTPEGEAGYKFTGWAPAVAETVEGSIEYVAQWEAKDDTAYTVEFYYEKKGAYSETADFSETRKGTTDTNASVTEEDMEAPLGYIFDQAAPNNLSDNIAGDGSLVLKLYFKQQLSVTYKPGLYGSFAEQVSSGLPYGAATPEFSGEPTAAAGYEFTGWSPKVESTVTANAVYIAQWKAKDDTAYEVQYFYEKDGQYKAKADDSDAREGTTGTKASVTDADKTPQKEGYVFDSAAANVLEAKIKGDGSTVLKVYFKQQFTVSYSKGEHGTFDTQTTEDIAYGTATPGFSGTPTAEAGYEFTGWAPEVADTVTADTKYVAQWKAKEDTAYTVKYFYQNLTSGEFEEADSDSRTGTTAETASVMDDDKIPSSDAYVFDADNSENVLSAKIKGNGTTVLKVYFKAQFTVSYSKGEHGTFETQSSSGLDFGSETPAFRGQPAGEAGYTFIGWAPAVADTVTKSTEYVAQWKSRDDTPYVVKFFYQKDGTYSEDNYKSDDRTGTTDSSVALTAEDKTPAEAGYVLDTDADNIFSAKLKGDGTTELRVYFKEQFTVSYAKGEHGKFSKQTYAGLDYGLATPEFNGEPEGAAGYDFAGWSPALSSTVSANADYVAQWTARSDTSYKVEFYYQKNGEYSEAADSTDSREGTTDTQASVTAEDKTPGRDGYVLDTAAANVFSKNIAGNGTTVLKVYFKEQFTVSYTKGEHGTFDAQSHSGLDFGAATPEFKGEPSGEKGYEFTDWAPQVSTTVESNIEYVAQWKAKDDTAYIVEYYYQAGGKYSAKADGKSERAGTTATTASVTDSDKNPVRSGYILDEDADNVFAAKIKGDGSTVLKVYFKEQFTVSYEPGDHGAFTRQVKPGLDYGAATPAFEGKPAGEAGYHFVKWSPGVDETVTESASYVAQWEADSDTAYKVEFFYQDKETGAYSAEASSKADRTGTTDTKASVTAEDKTPARDGYIFDEEAANVLEKNIKGDGTTVLKVYFKAQFTVSYSKGSHGTFEPQTESGLDFGAATPEFKGEPAGEAGYSFTEWAPAVATTVSGNAEYVAQWSANADTPYTVEYYYQKDGKYSSKADASASREGTTDTKASVDGADKTSTKAGYVFDSAADNVLEAKIKGDGTTVLKVYFKEQFTVKYSKGEHGTFETQTSSDLDYGTATPKFRGEPEGAAGYEFSGWEPSVADNVTANVEYVAQWSAATDTAYTAEYYGYDGNGGWTKIDSDKLSGTTDETAEIEVKQFEGYTLYEDYTDNVKSGVIAGDGSLVLKLYYKVNARVDIMGKCDSQMYNGKVQSVEGYDINAGTEVEGIDYNISNIAENTAESGLVQASLVTENASISKVAKGKDAGTYAMGLAPEQFRNTDSGFNVKFNVVSDGQLEITQRKVILTSADATKKFDGKPLTNDTITITGDGFVDGEGFGYYFTGSQTKVGESDNVFKCMITEEYQNTNPDNYDIELVYGKLKVTKSDSEGTPGDDPERSVINVIADGDDFTITEIAGGEVPLAKMYDANCCILHLLLMIGAYIILLGYIWDMKKRQKRIFELEETLAQAGQLDQ